MGELAAVSVIVYGRVQGVNFRVFVERHARALGLTGYVRNLSGGGAVEVRAEGEDAKLRELLSCLEAGPRWSAVQRLDVRWLAYSGEFSDFRIAR